jgi:hypothetical protein
MTHGPRHRAFRTALLVAIVVAVGVTFAFRIDYCVVMMDCSSPAVPRATVEGHHLELSALGNAATLARRRAESSQVQPPRAPLVALDDLAKAEATWNRMRPRSYELVVQVNCFCGLNESVIAHRVDGTQSRLLERLLIMMPSESDQRFNTVDHMFEWLRKSLAARPYILQVRFDQRLGYPINGQLDEIELVSDDYLFFKVVELVSIDP